MFVDNGNLPNPTNTLINNFQDSPDITITGGARAVISASLIRNILVTGNSVLISSNTSTLTVLSNATIQSGSAFTVDGLGYPANLGPGAGRTSTSSYGITGGGGGYGGYGGASYFGAPGGISYGVTTTPTDVGSGGATAGSGSAPKAGGSGGGSFRFTVNGVLTVNGRLSADGLAGIGSASGGGSGGSLYLTAKTLTGSGLISATGGAGDLPYGGGGAGGRIAFYFDTNLFAGSITARGGAGGSGGAAGTVYLNPNQRKGFYQLVVDNGGLIGTNTPLSVPSGVDLILSGGGSGVPTSLTFLNSLTINSNSWLYYSNNYQAALTVVSNVVIQRGGGISLKGAGFGPGLGNGAGAYSQDELYGFTSGGGGHGGYGASSIAGASGGTAYDSILQPSLQGSGGGINSPFLVGGAGGGAFRLTVNGTLQLDGTLTGNGGEFQTDGAGGGSGGSLWLSVARLTGTGSISANGGDGDYAQGGGGGGGRIALYYATNQFQGPITAWGGLGALVGGAGTIYTKGSQNSVGQVVVNNDGFAGTNTPIASLGTILSSNTFGLTISGAAVVHPQSGPLFFSSLAIHSGGLLTHLDSQTNLDVTVLSNATLAVEGFIGVSGLGYNGANGGPGAGQMTNFISGSGAGYGGAGGAGSSGIPGGTTYGSATQPTDRGSRGGVLPLLSAFCQGGGAARLRVGGTLALDGLITASGNAASIEGAGGGAGGSIWITARKLTGAGMVLANGGAGEPEEGGGGGGGRIAMYALTNNFAGTIAADGGDGATPGGDGTIYLATNIPPPQIIAQTPSGLVDSNITYLDLAFDSVMDFSAVSPTEFSLDTPNGLLPPNSFTTAILDGSKLRVSFPTQNELGYYEFAAGPHIADIYGQFMAAPYFGNFAIIPLVVAGRVVDANGLGVPFLTLQVSSNGFPILTDAQGYYSIDVYPGWSGTITPERGGRIFIPPSRTYVNVNGDLTNENFLMTVTSSLTLTSQQSGTNLNISWYGLKGATYQVLVSTNFVDWAPYGGVITGSNNAIICPIPVDPNAPPNFFRFRAGY